MEFIHDYINSHGYAPSRREVQEALGVSLDTAQRLIKEMVEEGLITIAPGIGRSIVITGSVMKQKEQGGTL